MGSEVGCEMQSTAPPRMQVGRGRRIEALTIRRVGCGQGTLKRPWQEEAEERGNSPPEGSQFMSWLFGGDNCSPYSSVVERATRNGEVGCSIQPMGMLFCCIDSNFYTSILSRFSKF